MTADGDTTRFIDGGVQTSKLRAPVSPYVPLETAGFRVSSPLTLLRVISRRFVGTLFRFLGFCSWVAAAA